MEELILEEQDDSIRIAFGLCGAMPKKILALMSKTHKELDFLVYSIGENGRHGKMTRIRNGSELEKFAPEDKEVGEAIYRFRKSAGIAWVNRIADRNGSGRFVEMTETGRVFFKGTRYALRYAVNRLAGGEPVEQTLARLPGLGQEYAGFLASLMKNETLARRI